jgi:hypothetical protein
MSMMNISEVYQMRKKTKRDLREQRRPAHLVYKHVSIGHVHIETHVGLPARLKMRLCVNLFLAAVVLIIIVVKVIAHY